MKALDASIEHWRELVKNGVPDRDQIKAKNCALCKQYNTSKAVCATQTGIKCPIYRFTGQSICRDTPWFRVNRVLRRLLSRQETKQNLGEAVQAELDFLIEVRDWINAGEPEHD